MQSPSTRLFLSLAALLLPLSMAFADVSSALPALAKVHFTWFGFSVYDITLSAAPENQRPDRILTDVPKKLHLEYLRAFTPEEIITGADKILRRTPGVDVAALAERLTLLNAAYEPVDKGDSYTLSYQPGVGTTLLRNGSPKITIPGADFAAAYFAIWLGEKPISEWLRGKLLKEEIVSE